ncbi:condensation domain-containing protein [Promicromonospora thailandica]|uniref:Condensation domain-containing protein n=1 Tax=Promicromonospora thailandica TaxID=765201 RepID=A0A9X2FZU5_9MICO|nr:condensation domain-containing protein [Promicromonospora thailandica]MCP2264239.1 Condensation domain-containing protein [Promicromonospora thailandica]BFF21085.1 trehalose-2-sulfate acyltransferase [Promicromonospora thailandica]
MILGALGTWTTAPGQVLHVRPTAPALAAAASAPVDPGPPSFLQGDHLRAYAARRAAGGVHRAWTGTATHLDGPFDGPALARALTRFVRRHEGLRTWFDVDAGDPVRHLVPADAVAFETVEVPAFSPTPGLPWDEWLTTHLTATFDAACRPDSWAPFALGVVVTDDGLGLFWGCDHAFTDGASQLMVLSEIEELYQAELGGDAPDEPTTAGSFLDHARAEHALAAATPPDAPEIQAWSGAVTTHGGRLPRFALDLGLPPGETAPVRIRSADLLDADGLARLEALAAEHGARFTGAVFAGIALTDARLTGAADWFGVTVVGSRGPGFETAQGWLCNFAPVTFPVSEGGTPASFGAVLPVADAAFRRARAVAAVPVHAALGVMLAGGVLDPASLGSPQLISYLDLRRFPGAGRPAYANGLHFTGEGRTANASLWVNRDHERLYVVMQTPDVPSAQAAADRYVAELRATFAAAADPGEPGTERREETGAARLG